MTGRAWLRGEARRLGSRSLVVLTLSWSLGACASRPGPAPKTAEEIESSTPSEARTFGWVGIAVGAEAAIVATATSVMMLEDKSTRDSNCNAEKVCSSVGLNANSQLESAAGWNAGAFVLAAAGLGIGSYLLLSHPIERHAQVYVSVTGVGIAGSF
jgi:hypothetical protein